MTDRETRGRLVRQRCEADGCDSLEAWVAAHPGDHIWTPYNSYEACAVCGVVRRGDDNNKPCNGLVRVTLREGES